MDILKMLAEFRVERQRIEEAIVALERLASGTQGKRRGRPPKWMSGVSAETGAVDAPAKSRSFSPAARKRMAMAQKKRWAAKKAQGKPSAS
jgi:hypothetical protein